MRVLVLGGAGLQGKAVLFDLSRSPAVQHVTCADRDVSPLSGFKKFLDMRKIRTEGVDVNDRKSLVSLMRGGFDVVIDVLPVAYMGAVAEAALAARVHVVNTMYRYQMPGGIHEKALKKEITLMPESGLDPGIDLVLLAHGIGQMEEVHAFHSYCGGIPEKKAADNPLQYKISWTWPGVLSFYRIPARIMKQGRVIEIPASDIHDQQWIETINIPGLGPMELILTGDAVVFAETLGPSKTLRSTTRATLRWPGHAALWKMFGSLNFLSDEPVRGLIPSITPYQFMVKHLEPQLQYRQGERDLVVLRCVVTGRSKGARVKLTYDLVDRRDLRTGLFAMNRTVGFTASIVAQMIAAGEIRKRGVLTAIKDIPAERFLAELGRRGIEIRVKKETEGTVARR
jgi:lysine 6-dehydrogenase